MSLEIPTVYLPGAGGLASFWRSVSELRKHGSDPFVFGYPGFGDTPPDAALRSLDDLLGWVLERSPPVFDLAAQSMGGVLAMRIALDHPLRVRRLALVATSGGIDTTRLGAEPWRTSAADERDKASPRFFVDDASDFDARLGEVPVPTLLIFGDDDCLAPPAVGRYLQSRIVNSRLVVVAGGTHDLAALQPELVAGLLDEHFRQG